MAFNANRFRSAKYVPRTEEVEIPALADFFDKDEKPVFVVRGMTASELAKSNEASDNSEKLKAIVEALTTNNKQAQKTAFQDIFGFGDDTPQEVQKRIMILTFASVSPEIDQSTAVLFADRHPVEFYMLTNKITELTGLGGFIEGKSPPSGKRQESESPASLESVEEGSSSS